MRVNPGDYWPIPGNPVAQPIWAEMQWISGTTLQPDPVTFKYYTLVGWEIPDELS